MPKLQTLILNYSILLLFIVLDDIGNDGINILGVDLNLLGCLKQLSLKECGIKELDEIEESVFSKNIVNVNKLENLEIICNVIGKNGMKGLYDKTQKLKKLTQECKDIIYLKYIAECEIPLNNVDITKYTNNKNDSINYYLIYFRCVK